MLCEKCKKNEATIFYQETINGNKRSYSLCGDCAAEMSQQGGLSSLPSFGSFHDPLLAGLFGISDTTFRTEKGCPSCGATLNDFKRTGKVGCPECYHAFSGELGGTVRSIHGNVKHVGRSPARFQKDREKKDRLLSLRTDLQKAVSEEDFERAAALRDEIRSLEGTV